MRRRLSLGQRLRQAREAAGLSQTALGKKLGVSQQQVVKWESKGVVPSDKHRRRLAHTLGIDRADLGDWIADALEDRNALQQREALAERNHHEKALAEMREIVVTNREINREISRQLGELTDLVRRLLEERDRPARP